MKYEAAIFDLDGTILDTLDDLADSMNHCLRENGMKERSREEIQSFVGNGIRRLTERAVPEGTAAEKTEAVYQSFCCWYSVHCAIKTKPYAGICEVLQFLKKDGIRLAVVSNKAETAVRKLCDDYFPGMFELAEGDRPGRQRKPAPDGLLDAAAQFGLTIGECVYIGDSEVDIQTAKNAGMGLLAAGWGFRGAEFLKAHGADTVLSEPQEILQNI